MSEELLPEPTPEPEPDPPASKTAVLAVVIVVSVVVSALLIGLGVYSLAHRVGDLAGDLLVGDAGCGEVIARPAPEVGWHRDPGTRIDYADAPPAFGDHWPNYLAGAELKTFYHSGDRPEVERLVHSLEHGWTIVWYDETAAADLGGLTAIAELGLPKVMVAPWTSHDGAGFPGGAHVAVTHWSVGNAAPGTAQVAFRPVVAESGPQGAWLYCNHADAEEVAAFSELYPYSDSPEPEAP